MLEWKQQCASEQRARHERRGQLRQVGHTRAGVMVRFQVVLASGRQRSPAERLTRVYQGTAVTDEVQEKNLETCDKAPFKT